MTVADYYPEPVDDPVNALLERVSTLARANHLFVTNFGSVGPYPLLCLSRLEGNRPTLYLSAGIHGDEPAGPRALLEALELELLADPDANLVIFPLLNPYGCARCQRTSSGDVDLNRCYKLSTHLTPPEVRAQQRLLQSLTRNAPPRPFQVALCLHEDWEASGAYLYELNPFDRPSLAPAILHAYAQTTGIEPATIIDGWPTRAPGLIDTPEKPEERPEWPEAIYLLNQFTDYCLTTETPSGKNLQPRIEAHLEAIRIVWASLLQTDHLPADRETAD
ncbi:MAG: M14 family metallocarboxypeptidase [Puniceicoccaceae bacterium]